MRENKNHDGPLMDMPLECSTQGEFGMRKAEKKRENSRKHSCAKFDL